MTNEESSFKSETKPDKSAEKKLIDTAGREALHGEF